MEHKNQPQRLKNKMKLNRQNFCENINRNRNSFVGIFIIQVVVFFVLQTICI